MNKTFDRSLPDTMRAAILTEQRTLEISQMPTPAATGDWVVLQTAAAGICGTELHFLDGILDPLGTPRVLGHEVAGIVIDPGYSDLAPGTAVAVYNVANCGACPFCRRGRDRLCTSSQGMIGFTRNGGFAEFVQVPARNLVPLPFSVTPEQGAVLSCSGMTAVHAVAQADFDLGDTVVVNGVGGVGLMVAQVAALSGASVIAVGDSEEKLALASQLSNATGVLTKTPTGYEGLAQALQETGLATPTVFFETVGTAQSMRAGVECLAPGGSFVQIGYTQDRLDFHPGQLIRNELRIITSAAGSKADLQTALWLAAAGRLHVHIADRYRLDNLHKALDRMLQRKVLGRNVVVFDTPASPAQ